MNKEFELSSDYIYVNIENKTAKIYIRNKKCTKVKPLEDFLPKDDNLEDKFDSNKGALDVYDLSAKSVYYAKREIEIPFEIEAKKLKIWPIFTYKKRHNDIMKQRDLAVEDFMKDYKELLKSPKLKVLCVEDYYYCEGEKYTYYDYEYTGLSKDAPKADLIIKDKNHTCLVELKNCMKGFSSAKFSSIQELKELEGKIEGQLIAKEKALKENNERIKEEAEISKRTDEYLEF